jgi:hypothetical protein
VPYSKIIIDLIVLELTLSHQQGVLALELTDMSLIILIFMEAAQSCSRSRKTF